MVKFGGREIDGSNRNIEDITFSSLDPDFDVSCTDQPQIPLSKSGKYSDALVWDGKPVVCGGLTLTNECYIYESNDWSLLANMSEERAISTGIAFPSNHGSSTGFWITGKPSNRIFKNVIV